MVETEHLALTDELYAITEKGRRNSEICENSLPFSVRAKCNSRLQELNATLRREAQVQASVTEREDGGCTLTLSLDDESGNLVNLSLFSGSKEQAERLAEGFRRNPERVYHSLLSALKQSAIEEA